MLGRRRPKRFPTRSQLLRSAFERVVATSLERIAIAEPVGDTLIQQQRANALETHPLDAERRREALVWTSYVLRAAIDEQLRDQHADRDAVDKRKERYTPAAEHDALLAALDAGVDALLAP